MHNETGSSLRAASHKMRYISTTRTFQEVSINSLLELKECPKTTCWKVLVLYECIHPIIDVYIYI